MKVMTANLENNVAFKFSNKYWLRRYEAFLHLIREEKPDIIGLQEVTDLGKSYLEDWCFPKYDVHGRSVVGSKFVNLSNPILVNTKSLVYEKGATYSLSDKINKIDAKLPLDFFPKICTLAHIKFGCQKYLIINTQLNSLLSFNRKEELKIISKIIKQKKENDEFLIVMGDLNMTIDNSLIDFSLNNDLDIATSNLESVSSNILDSNINHILVSKGLEYDTDIITNTYDGIRVSNNCPIMVRIKK